MSFLHWKEKRLLALAFERISSLLDTPIAWQHFENDRNYAFHNLYKVMDCSSLLDQEMETISLYGKYFQWCKIRMYTIDFLPSELFGEDCPAFVDKLASKYHKAGNILEAVRDHCRNLRKLTILHPPDVTFGHLQQCKSYIESLQVIASGRNETCCLYLYNLFYSSMDLTNDIIHSYLIMLAKTNILKNIKTIDFSHGLVLDRSCGPVPKLKLLSNVTTLKCPIHNLSTDVIMVLCSQKLQHLYLVNDAHTEDMSFSETSTIDWTEISKSINENKRNRFRVHYIYQDRSVVVRDLVPNIFTESVIFNNLTSGISKNILLSIADTYCRSITNLGFCSNYWEFLMHFTNLTDIDDNFAYIGRKCTFLKSFISCIMIPSSAILSLVMNSQSLKYLHFYKDNFKLCDSDKPLSKFQERLTQLVGIGFKMSERGLSTYNHIFDIPSSNPLLYDTCNKEF